MMSSSPRACAARILAAVLFLIAIFPSASFAMKVEDLDPAQHLKVGSITFKGDNINDNALRNVRKTKPRPFYLPWKARPDFEPDTFERDLKRLRIFYETQGYYHMRLTYNLTTEVKRRQKIVNAELDIVEGRSIKIEDINVSIDGYHPPPNIAPMTKLPVHRGDIFNQQAYQSGQQILRLFFVNGGYARTRSMRHAQVDVIRDTARIFYTVHVSSKAYFGKTRLRGNKKVEAKIITRERAYKEGEEYSNRKVDDSRTREFILLATETVVRRASGVFDPRDIWSS
jgi:outer membrane protein assembly factor BamA